MADLANLAGDGVGIVESMATPGDFVRSWLQRLRLAPNQNAYRVARENALCEGAGRWPDPCVLAEMVAKIPATLATCKELV